MASIFQSTPRNLPFNSPSPGQIALIAGSPNDDSSLLTDRLCEEIHDCGFNTIATSVSSSFISSSLQNCENNNLGLILYNATIFTLTNAYLSDYINKKGLAGWLLDYNLSPNDISKGSNTYNAYKSVVKYYDKNNIEDDKRQLIFIGLSADWEKDRNNKPLSSFPSYITAFQHAFHPSFWPYAYFPDLIPVGETAYPIERQLTFFKNLQYFAYISRYTDAPFWVYCRCQAFRNQYGFNGIEPPTNIMRGIVFSSLAYGAQGIYYWNYRPTPIGDYYYAPVNSLGEKTGTWDKVKIVNSEVRTFNHVFHNCEMIECRHYFTTTDSAQWLKKLENPIGPLKEITSESIKAPGLLISHIFNNGNDYLILVFNPFTPLTVDFTLSFSDYYKVYQLNEIGKEELIINTYFHLEMNPGNFKIFRWE